MKNMLYICAPYATRTGQERAITEHAIHWAYTNGFCPIFMPSIIGPIDKDPDLRAKALRACAEVITVCPRIVVVGERRTEGMTHDLEVWHEWWTTTKKPPMVESSHDGWIVMASTVGSWVMR